MPTDGHFVKTNHLIYVTNVNNKQYLLTILIFFATAKSNKYFLILLELAPA